MRAFPRTQRCIISPLSESSGRQVPCDTIGLCTPVLGQEDCPDPFRKIHESVAESPFDVVGLLTAVRADPANLRLSLTTLRHRKRFCVTHQRNLGCERAVAPAVLPRHWYGGGIAQAAPGDSQTHTLPPPIKV